MICVELSLLASPCPILHQEQAPCGTGKGTLKLIFLMHVKELHEIALMALLLVMVLNDVPFPSGRSFKLSDGIAASMLCTRDAPLISQVQDRIIAKHNAHISFVFMFTNIFLKHCSDAEWQRYCSVFVLRVYKGLGIDHLFWMLKNFCKVRETFSKTPYVLLYVHSRISTMQSRLLQIARLYEFVKLPNQSVLCTMGTILVG